MSALTNFRQLVGRAARWPGSYFRSEWERWAPRTRRLFVGLLTTAVSLLLVLGSTAAFSSISSLEEENGHIRDALAEMAKHHDEYLEAKTRNAVTEARIGNDPPQLTADLETAAHGENVPIAESSERPATPVGKRYLQHDLDIKVREVDLQSLSKFMRRVETGPRFIFFTRISLKHRYSEQDKLDAELTATAFEKVKDDKSKKKSEAAKPTGKKD